MTTMKTSIEDVTFFGERGLEHGNRQCDQGVTILGNESFRISLLPIL